MFRFNAVFAAAALGVAGTMTLSTAQAALPADLPTYYQVSTLTLSSVNDLAFNQSNQTLLASVGSSAGFGVGNTITRIGLDGAVLGRQFVGSEPGQIALSADGTVGYVALQAAPVIKKFDAQSGQVLSQIDLPGSYYNGTSRAEDMAVSPDNANVLAVSQRNLCCSPRHEGVVIYQDGQALANRTPGHTGSNSIEFGADGSTLYGYNNETTEFGFRTMAVDSAGVRTVSVTDAVLYGFYQSFTYEQGLAYSSTGVVFDPALGRQLGSFMLPSFSAFTASVANKRAYALGTNGQLTVYDFDTFTPITTYDLSADLQGQSVSKLIYTASGSLAAVSAQGVHVLTAVPEASAMWMGVLGLIGVGLAARASRQRPAC